MRPEYQNNPRIGAALDELKDLISSHYPTAAFQVSEGEDPDGVYLDAVVDIEDTDEVVDTFIDRLLQLQIEEQLPVYVIPVRPVQRVADELHRRTPVAQAPLPPTLP